MPLHEVSLLYAQYHIEVYHEIVTLLLHSIHHGGEDK